MRSRSLNASLNAQTRYTLRAVYHDLMKRKFGTFLTVLVIAVSLTIPTVSYLLWKNTHQAAVQFYPNPELTVYLHKNLSEQENGVVVQKILSDPKLADKVESHQYISRQKGLEDFTSWSKLGEELSILDENPLPAVVTLKPKSDFTTNEQMLAIRDALQQIKGVEDVRLANDWLEKLTALSWLIARTAIVCGILMLLAVFLVIGNSVRSDVSSSKPSIEVMQLLGATEHFIARPFIYTGMFYGFAGSVLAALFSSLLVGYFTGIVKYVTDIFTVKFELHSLNVEEWFFLIIFCVFLGWLSAKFATNQHIQKFGN